MSLGLILIILLVIFLLGGFSGRFGGYGYGWAWRNRCYRRHSDRCCHPAANGTIVTLRDCAK